MNIELAVDCSGLQRFDRIHREVRRCQYLNTSVTNAATRRISWKKAAVKASTSAKNVEAQICKNYSRAFPWGKVTSKAIFAQPERADFLRKGFYENRSNINRAYS